MSQLVYNGKGMFSPTLKPQAGGQPIFGSQRLLSQSSYLKRRRKIWKEVLRSFLFDILSGMFVDRLSKTWNNNQLACFGGRRSNSEPPKYAYRVGVTLTCSWSLFILLRFLKVKRKLKKVVKRKHFLTF
jgi:hypothetical protein